MELSQEDREDFRAGRTMKDFLRTEAWRTLKASLERAIAIRKELVSRPLHTLDVDVVGSGDFVARAATLEHLKGAVIGLETALELPQRMIDAYEQIRSQHQEMDDDDDE